MTNLKTYIDILKVPSLFLLIFSFFCLLIGKIYYFQLWICTLFWMSKDRKNVVKDIIASELHKELNAELRPVMWSAMWQLPKRIQILMIESFLAERLHDEIDTHIGKDTWVQKNTGFGAKKRFESMFSFFLPEKPWERNWKSTGPNFFTSTSMIVPHPLGAMWIKWNIQCRMPSRIHGKLWPFTQVYVPFLFYPQIYQFKTADV